MPESKVGYYLAWVFWLCLVGGILFGLTGWILNIIFFHLPAEIFILSAFGSWIILMVRIVPKKKSSLKGD